MKIERVLRGPHLEVWADFAREVGGSWNAPAYGETPRIEVSHASGTLSIEGDVTMVMVGKVMVPVLSTKFGASLPEAPGHRFSVSRASFATAVAEWFGVADIQVGDDRFDKAFVLKGDTPEAVQAIFADPALRERYLRDFEGQLHRRDDRSLFGDPTPQADPLVLTVSGYVDTPERLRALWALFVATVARLPDRGQAGR